MMLVMFVLGIVIAVLAGINQIAWLGLVGIVMSMTAMLWGRPPTRWVRVTTLVRHEPSAHGRSRVTHMVGRILMGHVSLHRGEDNDKDGAGGNRADPERVGSKRGQIRCWRNFARCAGGTNAVWDSICIVFGLGSYLVVLAQVWFSARFRRLTVKFPRSPLSPGRKE